MPKTIFFDAVGTLFGVRSTVGEIYAQFTEQVGLSVDPRALNSAFIQSFKTAPRASFAKVDPQDLPRLEYEWWRGIAQTSYGVVGLLPQIPDFDTFFRPLFAYFETAAPWVLYPETLTVLDQLQSLDIELAIISNFDSRLYGVLQALALDQWFQSVTISTQVGAAKPEAAIFEVALSQQQCLATQAWHVGDSWAEDYEGSMGAGLQGIWLNRDNALLTDPQPHNTEAALTIASLAALPEILKEQR